MSARKFIYRGADNPSARLTDADVIEIRRLYMACEMTQKQIGERFGISTSEVNKIINRRYWKHLKEGG